MLRKKQIESLNKNERTFLKLSCTQLTYREIAVKMAKSPRTVDGYRDILFQKLKVTNRTGLVLCALKYKVLKINQIKL